MRYHLSFLVAGCLATAAFLGAQTPTPQKASPSESLSAVARAVRAPTESEVYCAGFFSSGPVQPIITVLSGQDAGLQYDFGAGDTIYLSKGRDRIAKPGGQYMLVRPIKDMNPTEAFPGQRALISKMGTLYAEVARIRVQVLHASSSTAQIVKSCQAVQGGDIAIPFKSRSAPPYRTVKFTDRFSPASGKAAGFIAAIKEFQDAAGAGDIVYANLGRKQGLKVGDYLRIFRTYASPSQYIVEQGSKHYLTKIMGVPIGRKLTKEEINSLPRTVVGEMMILSVQDQSSTAIVTYSWEDIYPGDQVELE